MKLEQMIYDYFWHIFFLVACVWYSGFKTGEWWQQTKDAPPPESNEDWW